MRISASKQTNEPVLAAAHHKAYGFINLGRGPQLACDDALAQLFDVEQKSTFLLLADTRSFSAAFAPAQDYAWELSGVCAGLTSTRTCVGLHCAGKAYARSPAVY